MDCLKALAMLVDGFDVAEEAGFDANQSHNDALDGATI